MRDDIARLIETGRRASLDGDGTTAITLYEEAYLRSRAMRDYATAADSLFEAARQARMNNDPGASLRFAELAFDLRGSCPLRHTLKAYLALGHHLINAGKDRDVFSLLREAESYFVTANILDVCEYLELMACAAALQGRASDAAGHFDTLLDISSRRDAVETQVMRLSTAAGNCATLGLFGRARLLHKRSVDIAQTHRIGYRVPLSLLDQAWTCLLSGDFSEGRILLESAEVWPNNHLYVRLFRSAVGVMLGSLSQDEDLLQRFLDLGVMGLAFNSEAPQRIGPIAAAVYEYHFSHGRPDSAKELLSRAVNAIDNPDGCWWLILQVARHGTREDVARTLGILDNYNDEFVLARASRLLIFARLARLDGRPVAADLASNSAELFSALGLQYFRAVALELAERYAEARHMYAIIGASHHLAQTARVAAIAKPRQDSSKLAPREREIALLVVRGLTNRQIAQRLGVAERTVKYYLTKAFDTLGCQNRVQLTKIIKSETR
jgi:DNA-binding CsgD family transcriptional regulator